ncbi:hypothetical protein PV396_41260 [Streptomyces sp. ME02-8801-2C]|uniref:hypothetical protein n=1 Tax=Streptomyces sp. ME02-8801-2C TaxID=3028680 RepID=UPI0029A21380|nr:hypothetical protein [Streptomyces sp. ME02-8801-2C]MDX3458296.1 hypothetical protein [Streptomyces sp. ME02-8801-2C]
MYDTPPGRPHGPAPDAGPDDELVGELRDLMEQAAAGLPMLPDLTDEAVRIGGRRRVRARAAVAGAVLGVLAIGGVGSAVLGGLGNHASAPVIPAVAPPAVPSTTPSPAATTAPVPVATEPAQAAQRARTAKVLTRALGDLIGTVSVDDAGRFAGRIDGHTFPVSLQVVLGATPLADCPNPSEKAMTCHTAWLPDRTEARVVVAGGALLGGQSLSVSYRYAESTVKLTVDPDRSLGLSPPVTPDQLVEAAGSSAVLAEVVTEMKEQVLADADHQPTNPESAASLAPPATTQPTPQASVPQTSDDEPSDAQRAAVEPSSVSDPDSTDSNSTTGGSQ